MMTIFNGKHPAAPPARDFRKIFAVGILVLASFLVYMNSLSNGFVWDDDSIILDNPRLTGIDRLPQLLTSEDTFPGMTTGFYRPVTYVSFFVDRALWGVRPFGFHLTNVLLHVGVTICLFLLIRLLFKDTLIAFLSAFIFALNPVNTETVNFLSGGRNTLLCALFLLLSFIYYLRDKRRLSLVFFLPSLFSKEFAVLFPVVLFIHDRFVATERKPCRTYLPYIALVAFYLAARSLVLPLKSGLPFDIAGLPGRLMLSPETLIIYLKSFLLPFRPKIPYMVLPPGSFDMKTALYILAVVALSVSVYYFRSNRIVLFSFAWLFVFFLPVSNIVPLGYISMADRYFYLSGMGLAVIMGFLLKKARLVPALVFLAVLCSIYVPVTVQRNKVWKTDETLYAQMISDSPESSMGYYNLGFILYAGGDTIKSRDLFRQASRKYPVTARSLHMLALTCFELGDSDDALHFALEARKLDPGFLRNYFLLSRIYGNKGELKKADEYRDKFKKAGDLEKKLRLRAAMFCDDAERFQSKNDFYKAEMLFRRALFLEPGFPRALLGLGSVIAQNGDIDKAIPLFKRVSKLEPANPTPHYDLSQAYRLKGMLKESERELSVFRRLGGKLPEYAK